MGTEQAKKLALRVWEEAWNEGRFEVLNEAIAPDAVERHDLGEESFKSHLKGIITAFRAGFPDLKAQVNDMVAEGDLLAMRVSITGTNEGPFFGNPPTGRPVQLEQFHIVQVNEADQVIRHEASVGLDDLFRQLGISGSGGQSKLGRQ